MKRLTFISILVYIIPGILSVNISSSALRNKMSSTYLKLIPTNPGFVPTKARQGEAKVFLSHIFKTNEIEIIATDDIEFVDQGANFESVSCNLCGHKIETEPWQDAMDNAFKSKFTVLTFITPCCHKKTSLNDLKYQWPAGFAKFEVSILDPNDDLKDNQVLKLENILDTKLRKIWAHY